MVIQADGEKYACDACVRGHRVSSCTHKDRHLNHINKKGRPVSQCQHCRGARKNRASHVKCVCAELGIVREGAALPEPSPSSSSSCQCMTGQRCTCALKRDALAADKLAKATTVQVASHRRSLSKPSVVNRRSDSVVPKYQNGHHPPLHRYNNAAHEYSPYPIRRSATLHGPAHSAQRSLDDLTHGAYSTSPSSLPLQSHIASVGGLADTGDTIASASVPSGLNHLGNIGPNGFVHGPASNAHHALSGGGSSSNARWSINDFSGMSAYSGEQFGNSADPSSAMSDAQFNWSEWDFNPVSAPQDNQQAASVTSVEHPGLSRSSSGTASDTGDSTFNPSDFKYAQLPASTGSLSASVAATRGPSLWPLDANWSSASVQMQDKTPLAMPSHSAAASDSGVPSGDYFGEFGAHEPSKFPTSRALDGPASFRGATTLAAFEGALPAMAMSELAPQLGHAWQLDPRAGHEQEQRAAQGQGSYQYRSWS